MGAMGIEEPGGLVQLIQLSISPVILISGVGMLLLTLTNRFGRVVDRTRELSVTISGETDAARAGILRRELTILHHRSRLVRLSIQLAAASILTTGVLILVLFVWAVTGRIPAMLPAGLFLAAVGLLVASVVVFLRDLRLSLEALDIEIGGPP